MPNYRLSLSQDIDADNPIGWGNVVVVPADYPDWDVRNMRNYNITTVQGTDDLGIEQAWERIRTSLDNRSGSSGNMWRTHTLAVQGVMRWARIFHGATLLYDTETRCFWYLPKETRDYYANPEVAGAWLQEYHGGDVAKAQTAQLEGERDQYRTWARGEVYVLTVEVETKWFREEDRFNLDAASAEVRTTWEPVDSLGGLYIDRNYTPQAAAKENFSQLVNWDELEVVDA